MIESFELWIRNTPPAWLITNYRWAWPTSESAHFLGMSLLVGTVGAFDLRLLGFAKGLSPTALHRLIPWGILGFTMNVVTGSMFFAATPHQYIYNAAFQFKMLFIVLTGLNVAVFYFTVYPTVKAMGPGDEAPLQVKVIAGVSLALWVGVLTCGRLITFYRP